MIRCADYAHLLKTLRLIPPNGLPPFVGWLFWLGGLRFHNPDPPALPCWPKEERVSKRSDQLLVISHGECLNTIPTSARKPRSALRLRFVFYSAMLWQSPKKPKRGNLPYLWHNPRRKSYLEMEKEVLTN